MPGYFALGALCITIVLVRMRVVQLKKLGIKAFKFGEIDKTDYLLPPFVLLFLYLIIASAFDLPIIGSLSFGNEVFSWAGVVLCVLGDVLLAYALISFGKSFRIGIDEDDPGELITTGAFAISRNPIYTAFLIILFGLALVFPNWLILLYIAGALLMFIRQISREEESLKKIYGAKYDEYCARVRRFL